MAMEDFFKDLYYVEKVRQPDGTGGFEYVYKIGDVFKGKATKSSTSEQTLASIRGTIAEQYMVTTFKNNVLEKDDIIMFVTQDNKEVYLRINENVNYTPENSAQSSWKYVQATLFKPDLRVVK